MNFSLNTPLERRAALAALTTYVNMLDGATIAVEDNPETGSVTIPVQTAVEVIPTVADAAPQVPSAAHAFAPPPYLSAPPAPAPSAAPLPNTPPPAVEVDSKGVAWDAALHAGNKSKNKDGTWRARRNSGGAADDTPEAPPAPVAPVAVTPPAPPVVAAPVAPSAAPATFQELMGRVMPAITGGKVTAAKITEVVNMAGVPNLPALAATPAAIPTVWMMIEPLLA